MAKEIVRYEVLSLRVSTEERKEIRQAAAAAGTTTDALLYKRIFGRDKC